MNRFVSLLIAAPIALAAFAACSSDPEKTDVNDPSELQAPLAGQGVQFRTPVFSVAAGQERQDCYFVQVKDLLSKGGMDPAQPFNLHRVQIVQRAGSHHMNLFRVKSVVNLDPTKGTQYGLNGQGECFKSSNWADWPLVANSQQSAPDQQKLDWKLPAGVAARFTPGEKLMLQIHYVNSTDQVTPWVGRGGINFYRSHDGDTIELGTLFATQQNIRVCKSNPTPSYSGTCAMTSGTHTVAAANGHFHSRGRRFRIWTWDSVSTTQPDDSAKFYDNMDWNEPLMATGLDTELSDPGGVWWTCDYQWSEPSVGCDVVDARDPQHANDCCYTFGPKVESSEHCNLFVYYYPKANAGITCF